MRHLLTTKYAQAAERGRRAKTLSLVEEVSPVEEAKTLPPLAEWFYVTSYGVYYPDLQPDEQAEIRAQYPNVMLSVLAGAQWKRRR